MTKKAAALLDLVNGARLLQTIQCRLTAQDRDSEQAFSGYIRRA